MATGRPGARPNVLVQSGLEIPEGVTVYRITGCAAQYMCLTGCGNTGGAAGAVLSAAEAVAMASVAGVCICISIAVAVAASVSVAVAVAVAVAITMAGVIADVIAFTPSRAHSKVVRSQGSVAVTAVLNRTTGGTPNGRTEPIT